MPSHAVAQAVIADRAHDARINALSKTLATAGKHVVIPAHPTRTGRRDHDSDLKHHHLIEFLFARLKQYRAFAAHCGKTARNVLGDAYLVATVVRLHW